MLNEYPFFIMLHPCVYSIFFFILILGNKWCCYTPERNPMVGNEMEEQVNVLHTAKERMNIKDLVNKLYESKDLIIEIGLYGSIGFFAGYLLKRYSGIVVLLILFIASLVALNQIELISVTINWNSVYEFFGIQSSFVATDNVASFVWEWMRVNVVIVVSAIIGFLIGLRIG